MKLVLASLLRRNCRNYCHYWKVCRVVKASVRNCTSSVTNSPDVHHNETSKNSNPRHVLHVPVMKEQVVDILQPQDGKVILDMTFGAGGHTKALLEKAPGVRMFCLDRDSLAHEEAKCLAQERGNVVPLQGKFSSAHHLLADYGLGANSLDGVLFDVGASSMQFDDPGRGFSLSRDGPLDMRMDQENSEHMTAEDVVNSLHENDLYKIFKNYGEEKRAKQIAQAIVDSRYAFGRIRTTRQLADIVSTVFDSPSRQDKLHRHAHVATKVFQALRIFVNDELNELYNGLLVAHHLLKPGGTCAVISFHSLEDRIAKRHFQGINMDAQFNMSSTDQHRVGKKLYKAEEMDVVRHSDWSLLFKGALLPSEQQIRDNPRARSAKLRAASKV